VGDNHDETGRSKRLSWRSPDSDHARKIELTEEELSRVVGGFAKIAFSPSPLDTKGTPVKGV